MYIIIVGGGKVGYYLSKSLLSEGHEVLVIEKQPEKCEKIIEDLGQVCLPGDGSEISVLAEAGTSRADMFIAVSDADEDNLVACQMAKQKFGVTRTVTLIHNPRNESVFKNLGIDHTICSTSLIMEQIEQEIPTHPLVHLFSMANTDLELVEVKVSENSIALGKKIKELTMPPSTQITLIISKDEKPKLPSPELELKPGDQVIAICRKEYENDLYTVFSPAKQYSKEGTRKVKL